MKAPQKFKECIYPIASMYGIFAYIYHKNQTNVGKYTIHGWYGYTKNDGPAWKNGTSGFNYIAILGVSGIHVKFWGTNHGNPKPSYLGVITHILRV